MILISAVITCPVSYYMIKIWLETFAYQTDILGWIFALTFFVKLINCFSHNRVSILQSRHNKPGKYTAIRISYQPGTLLFSYHRHSAFRAFTRLIGCFFGMHGAYVGS